MASATFKATNKKAFDPANDPDVLHFAAQEAARGMSPYVPFRNGILDASAVAAPGYVEYRCHYAVYNYYGTDRRFRKDSHPDATAYWDRAYAEAHGKELARAVGRYIYR